MSSWVTGKDRPPWLVIPRERKPGCGDQVAPFGEQAIDHQVHRLRHVENQFQGGIGATLAADAEHAAARRGRSTAHVRFSPFSPSRERLAGCSEGPEPGPPRGH